MRPTMKTNTIPAIRCPFPVFVNPHAADAQRASRTWVQRFDLGRCPTALVLDTATSRMGWLAAHCHPEAPYPALQLVTDWYTWMFFADDERDADPIGQEPCWLAATCGRYLDILHGAVPAPDESPLCHALQDLRDRLLALMGRGAWMARFLHAMRVHLGATVWEASNRSRGVIPDARTYRRMRPLTSGVHVDVILAEMAEPLRLPTEVRTHAVVQRLTAASNNVICWFNDCISLEKEQQQRDVHNLVLVLQHEYGLALEAAMRRAVLLHNREVQRFVELTARLPSFGAAIDAKLERYVRTMRARMRGNLVWSLASGRYRSSRLTIHACPEGAAGAV